MAHPSPATRPAATRGKAVDRFEETDDQAVTTFRERAQFTQRLTLVFADGRTARGGPEGAAKLSHILCSTYLVLVPAIAHHIFRQELY